MYKKFFSSILFIGLLVCVIAKCNIASFASCNIYFVNNQRDLNAAVSQLQDNDFIILVNDVYLEKDLEIDKSVTLDLNGNTIYVTKDDAAIVIGKETLTQEEVCTEKVAGYYSYEDKENVVNVPDKIFMDNYGNIIRMQQAPITEVVREKVWNPPVIEVEYKDVYQYSDEIEVLIRNGEIIHSDGLNGEDGKEDTWLDFDGRDGSTPNEPIKMLAGTLKLFDVAVYGGDGGNGGNGKYQSLLHVPFVGGGAGGNGGNGANGGNAIKILREECNVVANANTIVVPGKAGLGGNSGRPNQNAWLYNGPRGIPGNNGVNGEVVAK